MHDEAMWGFQTVEADAWPQHGCSGGADFVWRLRGVRRPDVADARPKGRLKHAGEGLLVPPLRILDDIVRKRAYKPGYVFEDDHLSTNAVADAL